MDTPSRREVIVALSALPIIGCNAKEQAKGPVSLATNLDQEAMLAIAQSYADASDDPVGADVQSSLFRAGKANLDVIQKAVKNDFAEGLMFVHGGWRLSHTEGKLFTLLVNMDER